MKRVVLALPLLWWWALGAAPALERTTSNPRGFEDDALPEQDREADALHDMDEPDTDEDQDESEHEHEDMLADDECDFGGCGMDDSGVFERERHAAQQRAAQQRRLRAPAVTSTTMGTCVDLDEGSADCLGATCRDYTVSMCGEHDTVTFKSNTSCCVCGGGQQKQNAPGATDSGGDTCAWYSANPALCGCCDDDDFSASNCAACAVIGSDGEEKPIEDELARFPLKTTAIRRAGYSLNGMIPSGLPSRFPHLVILDLADNRLTGGIPHDLWDLPQVQQVWLQGNRLQGTLPDAVGNAIHLTHIDLSDNELEGSIPNSTAAWSNITFFSAARNNMTGLMPGSCSSWVRLRQLDLSDNNINGSVPECVGNWRSIERLSLARNGLTGSLSNSVAAWTSLCFVSLGQNTLSGSIPDAVGNWREVKHVQLNNNQLSGQIPQAVGSWRSIERVTLAHNDLNGSVPKAVGAWVNVLEVRMNSNRLGSGAEVCDEMFSGRGMDYRGCQSKTSSGKTCRKWTTSTTYTPARYPNKGLGDHNYCRNPDGDSRIWCLTSPGWGYCNPIGNTDDSSTAFPAEVGAWRKVRVVDFQSNTFANEIPEAVGNWLNVEEVRFNSNDLSGPIPEAVGNWTSVLHVHLDHNRLTGVIPEAVGKWGEVEDVDFSYNKLSGHIPGAVGNWVQVQRAIFSKNTISGRIPDTVGNWGRVKSFSVSSNTLSGPIPEAVGNWAKAESISFGGAGLSGRLPEAVGNWAELRTLSLWGNSFSGPLPDSVGNWRNIVTLKASSAMLRGEIPETVVNWRNVKDVLLNDNKLSGHIPAAVGGWLQVEQVNLQKNKLNGSIPEAVGSWSKVARVYLNNNEISGSIPSAVGNWTHVKQVFLQHTELSGGLPDDAAHWVELTHFDCQESQIKVETMVMGAWTKLSDIRLAKCFHPALADSVVSNWKDVRRVELRGGYDQALPRGIGQWSKITEFAIRLQDDARFPDEVANWRDIRKFTAAGSLKNCSLPSGIAQWEGIIDVQIWKTTSPMTHCGQFPDLSGKWGKVRLLWLVRTGFTGRFPGRSSMGQLYSFKISDNRFDGLVPADDVATWVNMEYFQVDINRFSGEVPSVLANLTRLKTIKVDVNHFSGSLPKAFEGAWPSMRSLGFSYNNFVGTTPDFRSCRNAWLADFKFNAFSKIGPLPMNAEHVYLDSNNLTEFPTEVERLPRLRRLTLQDNHISRWPPRGLLAAGSFTPERCSTQFIEPRFQLPELLELNVSGNPLSEHDETIPDSWGSVHVFLYSLAYLPKLATLTCRDCHLRGSLIPTGGQGFALDDQALVAASERVGLDNMGFKALHALDLAGNHINRIQGHPSNYLTTADFSNNRIVGMLRSWFNEESTSVLVMLKVFDNPRYRKSVEPPSGSCPQMGAPSLTADPYGYSTVANEGYECTSLCGGTRTRYVTDYLLDVDALCRCLPGHGGRGITCAACREDTYSVGLDEFNLVRECRQCPEHARTVGPNSTAVSQCKCPTGRYFSANHTINATTPYRCARCSQWPLRTTVVDGADNENACMCNTSYTGLKSIAEVCGCEDEYYMDHVALRCTRCSQAELCQWGANLLDSVVPPRVKPGYWVEAPPLEITQFSGNVVWRCVGKGACPQDGCADGRQGRACSLCVAGKYGPADGPCKDCPGSPNSQRWTIGLGVLALLPVPVVLHCVLSAKSEDRGMVLALRSLRISMKQVIKHLQTIAVVSGFNVDWPPLAKSVFQALQQFTIDLPSWAGAACLQEETSAALEVGFNLCTPVVFVVLTLIAMPFSWAVAKVLACTLRQSLLERLPVPPENVGLAMWDVVRVVLFTGLLFFATLLQNTMAMLMCIPSPSEAMALTVSTYPHLECSASDGAWLPLAIISGVAFLVYVGGIAVSVFFAWRGALKTMAATDCADRGWFAFLFEDFRTGCMRWPLLLMAKETTFVLIGVVLPGQGAVQLLLTAAIALIFLVRLASDSPYQDKSNTSMEVWNMGSVVLICFYSAGMGYQSTPGVGNVLELFTDGDNDPIYRARAIGMVTVQVISIFGPSTIIVYQVLCAFKFTIKCVPRRLRPPTQEQTTEWIEHFTTSLGVPDLLTAIIKRFDGIDFDRFQAIFETSPAVIGFFQTTEQAKQSWERRFLGRLSSRVSSRASSTCVSSAAEPDDAKNQAEASDKNNDLDPQDGDSKDMQDDVKGKHGGSTATYEDLVQQIQNQSQQIQDQSQQIRIQNELIDKYKVKIETLESSKTDPEEQKDGAEDGFDVARMVPKMESL